MIFNVLHTRVDTMVTMGVEQPEGDCGIEAGGVEAWKEHWEPVGLGGFGVSNEKLPPEPRGGCAESLGPSPGGLKIPPGKVGMVMRSMRSMRSAKVKGLLLRLCSCSNVSPCLSIAIHASITSNVQPERCSDATEFLQCSVYLDEDLSCFD